jgi:hypothetical protein
VVSIVNSNLGDEAYVDYSAAEVEIEIVEYREASQSYDFIKLAAGTTGGFTYTLYWSSSEGYSGNEYSLSFDDGGQIFASKNSYLGVRAIRAFTY